MSEDKDLLEKEKQGREASDENMKEDEYEKVCFLCRRPESKTGPMITLLRIYIFVRNVCRKVLIP